MVNVCPRKVVDGEYTHVHYQDGEEYLFWENPEVPFGVDPEKLREYFEQGKWILLFNAIVLAGLDS